MVRLHYEHLEGLFGEFCVDVNNHPVVDPNHIHLPFIEPGRIITSSALMDRSRRFCQEVLSSMSLVLGCQFGSEMKVEDIAIGKAYF